MARTILLKKLVTFTNTPKFGFKEARGYYNGCTKILRADNNGFKTSKTRPDSVPYGVTLCW